MALNPASLVGRYEVQFVGTTEIDVTEDDVLEALADPMFSDHGHDPNDADDILRFLLGELANVGVGVDIEESEGLWRA